MKKLRIVTLDSRWELAHGAVTRRPPIPLYTIVARTKGDTYDVGVWELSIIQEFSVAPCQTLALRFATLSSLHLSRSSGGDVVNPLSHPRASITEIGAYLEDEAVATRGGRVEHHAAAPRHAEGRGA
jgi:hypothetical protein